MFPKRVTMRDIAAAAGVSVMTVSNALRNSNEVSEATRLKILTLVEEMGYRPDPLLSRLSSYRRNKTNFDSAGAVMAWLNLHSDEATWNFCGSHYLEALKGARLRAAAIGYRFDTFCVPELGGWARVNNLLLARGIEAVIIGQPPAGVFEAHLDWNRMAAVAVGRALRSPVLPRVVLNHVELVHRVMSKMRDLGYRRIGLVMERGECEKNCFRNFGGYFSACQQLDVPESEWVPPLTPDELTAEGLGIWIQANRVDGILVHREDQMDHLLPKLGLRVPDDVGFAHLSTHKPSDRISGYWFDPALYGSWAVDLAHWLLDRGERGISQDSPSVILTGGQWQPGRTLRVI
jgi:LacI family transcriptional regulator